MPGRLFAETTQLALGGPELVWAATDEGEAMTRAREDACCGEADAGGGAGDEDVFAHDVFPPRSAQPDSMRSMRTNTSAMVSSSGKKVSRT